MDAPAPPRAMNFPEEEPPHRYTDSREIILNRLKFYQKNNPKFADKIFRRILNYLNEIKTISIAAIEEEFSAVLHKNRSDVAIDPNRPLPMATRLEIDALNNIILAHAMRHLSHDQIFDQINLLIKREAAKKIIEVSERPDVTFKELYTEIQSFSKLLRGETLLSREEAIGTRVALIRNLISDQLKFIKIAKQHLTIRDFGWITKRIIGTQKGMGKIGGKAAGLLLASTILTQARERRKEIGAFRIPESYFVRSDVVSEFITQNNLDEFINIKYADAKTIRSEYPLLQKIFTSSRFVPEVVVKLRLMLEEVGEVPLIVRSSSHLEDRVGAAFSGKYLSLFIGNQGPIEKRLEELVNAIVQVYASTFAPDPLEYRKERGLIDYQEQMAIIIQAVVGRKYGRYFCPDFAGVAFSRNEFRWSPRIRREDGMLRLVLGLGTRAVDRVGEDYAKIVPLGVPTLSAAQRVEDVLHYSQSFVDVIHLEDNRFETIPLTEFLGCVGAGMPAMHDYLSIYENGQIADPSGRLFAVDPESAVVTFRNLLGRTLFPRQMKAILETLEEAYGVPVDVEFAHDGESLHLLQCRALAEEEAARVVRIPRDLPADRLLFRADRFVRSGVIDGITHVVYIDPSDYERAGSYEELVDIGRAVGLLNTRLPRRRFILMGPGRWGSRGDIKLGVRVTYADIHNTALLIEIARRKGNYVPDVSYGTHFFQDLVEAKIAYLPIYPDEKGAFLNEPLLRSGNRFAELVPEFAALAEFVHVFDVARSGLGEELTVLMDGENDEAAAVIGPVRVRRPSADISSESE